MSVRPSLPTDIGSAPTLAPRRISDEQRLIAASFRTGKFADPPHKIGIAPGFETLTKKHKQLIGDLRDEGARLTFDKGKLTEQAAVFERRYRKAKMDVMHTKEQLALVQSRYGKMAQELEDAQEFLRKLDALFSGEKTQRMARAMSLPSQELEGALFVEQSATPNFAWTNPFER